MPYFVPKHREVILGSGVAELACAAGLLLPRTRRLSAWASTALLVAVFPGNLKMADDARRCRSRKFQAMAYGRLPLQLADDPDRPHRGQESTVSDAFVVDAEGVHLEGTLRGAGDRVLLLHGGPGLGVEYLEPLADELADGYAVATYQQRGIAPSQIDGPFAVGDHVADVVRVLDELGWERATLVGHSWGGHLALHVAAAAQERLTGVLAVDPLGAVDDGGMTAFAQELGERTPPEDRDRAAELDERVLRGEGTAEDDLESLRLYWPAYFSSREAAPPMPPLGMSTECYAQTAASISASCPGLERALPSITSGSGS